MTNDSRASTEVAERNYRYDLEKFGKHSSAVETNPDPVALAAALTSAYHSVEKGLAMEATRAGFAAPKIEFMLKSIAALEQAGHAGLATRGARGCLQSYVRFHDDRNLALPGHLDAELRSFVNAMDRQYPGGSISVTREEIRKATDFDYDKFVRTRHSVRHFTGESVSPDVIRKAVGQAIKTPRTCNREMRRVYAAYDGPLRDHLLTFQRGNVGFGHKLGAVLIVTVDLREFDMIGERNQCWTDGGLFAMSLVFALHAAGLGTCMLNWSADCDQDRALRAEFNIPDHEVVITMLGVGQVPEKFEVAASPAPTADEILSLVSMRNPKRAIAK